MPLRSSRGLHGTPGTTCASMPTTASQAPSPHPGKVGARVRADRAVQFMSLRQQQGSARDPGNHLRLDHHVLAGGT